MPDLLHSLRGHDLGQLRIIAEMWGVELRAADADEALLELTAAAQDAALATELITSLNPEAQAALKALEQAKGRLPWTTFVRQFGEIREMGAGRRDREKPYLKPISIAETLYYRGLLARAFFDTDKGPREFAYLPDEWLHLIQASPLGEAPAAAQVHGLSAGQALGRRAVPAEKRHMLLASDRILDEATTLLAALRTGQRIEPDFVLQGLLNAAGLLDGISPQAERTKAFLEAARPAALKMLVDSWQTSDAFNELRLMPALICEGEWINEPRAARQFVLNLLGALPEATWWSLTAFVADVKSKQPDFQRPAGDYDSWFIKSAADGGYLRGFVHWDRVDGASIRFLITDVMHRLGMLDLASPDEGETPEAFRTFGAEGQRVATARRSAEHGARFPTAEDGKLHVRSQGAIMVPRLAPRAVRYQLARFCEWGEQKADEYQYRITGQSLSRAVQQGLKVEQLLVLLAKHAEAGVPPALVKGLKRWEANGTEARAETETVLRVSRPEILEQLRNSRSARFLGEPLGPTAVIIKPGAQAKVIAALAELGIVAQDNTTETAVVDGEQRPRPAERSKEKKR